MVHVKEGIPMSTSGSIPGISAIWKRLGALSVSRPRSPGSNARLGTAQVGVTLDGSKIDARRVALHPGPLDFIVGSDDGLHAFSAFEPFSEFVTATLDSVETSSRAVSPVGQAAGGTGGTYGNLKLYKDVNMRGAVWQFDAQWGAQLDFRHVFKVLWWDTNINDMVSSVDAGGLNGLNQPSAFVCLCSDMNLAGSRLWCWSLHSGGRAPGYYEDLGKYGWNDVASSMFFQAL
jgi:hypothetical protein